MALAKDSEMVFKCGISVAPVTSWRFYDTIYTERYMGINSSATNYFESDVATEDHIKSIGKHQYENKSFIYYLLTLLSGRQVLSNSRKC